MTEIESQPMVRVERDGVTFTLLGTAHVSRVSAEAVRDAVASGDYDAVAIELDAGRKHALEDVSSFEKLDLLAVIKQNKVGMVAAQLALAGYQKRIAEQFGIEPGAEMRAAMDGARAQQLPLHLIDREVGLTLKRCAAALGFWARLNLLTGLGLSLFSKENIAEEEIERLKQGDLLSSTFAEFAAESPALFHALIDERDEFMAASLVQQARHSDQKRWLVVIGAGHMKGLAAYLSNPDLDAAQSLAKVSAVPPPSIWPKLIGYAFVALLVGGLLYGFSQGFDVGTELLLTYLLFTAGGALIGAIVALAHPLAAIGGALSAPLTVLHPLLAAGMFSASIELWLRKPTISDLSKLRDDAPHVGRWWKNGAIRIILIFTLTNIGTGLGVWATGFEFVRRLT